jgi:hypothetical protein
MPQIKALQAKVQHYSSRVGSSRASTYTSARRISFAFGYSCLC